MHINIYNCASFPASRGDNVRNGMACLLDGVYKCCHLAHRHPTQCHAMPCHAAKLSEPDCSLLIVSRRPVEGMDGEGRKAEHGANAKRQLLIVIPIPISIHTYKYSHAASTLLLQRAGVSTRAITTAVGVSMPLRCQALISGSILRVFL